MGNTNTVTECPNCGSKELGKGIQDGYAVVRPAYKRMSLGSNVEHILCTELSLKVM
ncbi:transcription initiation factor TFIIIB [Priestia megaterium]|uniref:transcription initiation factor TFIIIB n=1 Tax=Priestia megaterium TaxID=1404 RepID=UPI002E1FE621